MFITTSVMSFMCQHLNLHHPADLLSPSGTMTDLKSKHTHTGSKSIVNSASDWVWNHGELFFCKTWFTIAPWCQRLKKTAFSVFFGPGPVFLVLGNVWTGLGLSLFFWAKKPDWTGLSSTRCILLCCFIERQRECDGLRSTAHHLLTTFLWTWCSNYMDSGRASWQAIKDHIKSTA